MLFLVNFASVSNSLVGVTHVKHICYALQQYTVIHVKHKKPNSLYLGCLT